MTEEAFWDASMLVSLCVEQQPFTHIAHKLFKRYDVIVWWGTPVEVISALARLKRAGEITEIRYRESRSELEKLLQDWEIIKPLDTIRHSASGLLEKHPLRAGDALQLAAALAWCEGMPTGELFLTADRRLGEIAGLTGFSLEPTLMLTP